jgi:outer membrane protein assembly factor BamD (BamD/ComL family)
MRSRLISYSLLLFLALPVCRAMAQRPKIPNNSPKATVLRDTDLYVNPDTSAARLAMISPGREMMIVDRNGPWVRVFANTDVESSNSQDAPVFGSNAGATPISGWMQAKGVVDSTTPKGDLILFGEAATEEVAASEPHAAQGTAQAAQRLYQRVVQFFPQSPLAPEAAWRSADISWQLQKADVFSLPSAHEKAAYLREQIDETEMRKLEKNYPHSRWSDLAAWDMLDNKICGDWQGSTECPEKEAELYEKYAQEHPDSSKAPEALYEAAYRQAVLNDMYNANAEDKRAQAAEAKAVSLANLLQTKYANSDYAPRAAALVYKLEASIPIYGTGR